MFLLHNYICAFHSNNFDKIPNQNSKIRANIKFGRKAVTLRYVLNLRTNSAAMIGKINTTQTKISENREIMCIFAKNYNQRKEEKKWHAQ